MSVHERCIISLIDEGDLVEDHVGFLEKYNNFTVNDIEENIRWDGKQWDLDKFLLAYVAHH